MGNYYSGFLWFTFDLKYKDIADDLIRYAQIVNELDDPYLSGSEFIKRYPHSIIAQGLDLFRSPQDEIRRPRAKVFTECDNGGNPDYSCELENIVEDMQEKGGYNKTLNADSVIDYMNKVRSEDVICFGLMFVITEKFFEDKGLKKLIDLWSPYLCGSKTIGVIKDEDHTFKKEYRIGNSTETDHWPFCGDWCDEYSDQCSCVKMKCNVIYQKGYVQAKKGIKGDDKK